MTLGWRVTSITFIQPDELFDVEIVLRDFRERSSIKIVLSIFDIRYLDPPVCVYECLEKLFDVLIPSSC
jgi:hypothetical protein